MKKLKLYTGGHPFVADDLEYLQNGFVEAFKALALSWTKHINVGSFQQSEDVCVLSGITLIEGTYDLRPGYAFIDGEICFSPAWTRPLNSNWSDWGLRKRAEQFDNNGNRVYFNGVSRQTFSIFEAEWVLISSIAQSENYIPLEDLTRFTITLYKDPVDDVLPVVNSTTPNNILILRKNKNRVFIEGKITDLVMNGATNYSIPVGWRPSMKVMFNCPMEGFPDKYATLRIEPNGAVVFVGQGFSNPSSNNPIHFSGVYTIVL